MAEEQAQQLIARALQQARRDLLDLTRRNRLLHAPLAGKRPWCLALSGHTPDEIFGKLRGQENFPGYAFGTLDESAPYDNSPELSPKPRIKSSSASARRPRLQTKPPPDKLDRRLTKIFREERTLEEEQGLSTLYLALGFLKWFDNDQSEEETFAPLILVPVTMDRVSGGGGYLLRARDDEIAENVSLREKLRTNFGIQLPPISDDEQFSPSGYFDALAREIRRLPRWEVDRHAVGLGFFSFSKYLMWRDLDASNWPDSALFDHPLLNALIGGNSVFEAFPPLVPDNEKIDQHIDVSNCAHVVDADSSQAIVIEEARIGRNLLVQGPPGTGKSQTITNVIASATHAGKTVLFVAEKTAALQVVYERLKKAGLGPLCLEVHSRKANKSEVLKALAIASIYGSI